jgi:hypothetical protein
MVMSNPQVHIAEVGTIAAKLFDAFRLLVIMECGADVGASISHDAETGTIVYRSDHKNAASHAGSVSRLARGAQWMREQGVGATIPCIGEAGDGPA